MAMLCEPKVEFLAKTFDDFREKLREHEINTNTKYVCTKSPSSFKTDYQGSIDSIQVRGKSLHWHGAVPCLHFGTRVYSCHQGKDLNLRKKQKYAEQRDNLVRNNQISIKKLNMMQHTKKLDCPVTIKVTCLYWLSDYEMQEITDTKKAISNRIKNKIQMNESIGGEFGYLFALPELSDHKNHVIDAAIIEPVDPTIQENCSISYNELKKRGSAKKRLILRCKELMCSLESVVWKLENEDLKEVHDNLENILKEATAKVKEDESTGPLGEISAQHSPKKKDYDSIKRKNKNGTLKRYGLKTKGLYKNKIMTGHVSTTADIHLSSPNNTVGSSATARNISKCVANFKPKIEEGSRDMPTNQVKDTYFDDGAIILSEISESSSVLEDLENIAQSQTTKTNFHGVKRKSTNL